MLESKKTTRNYENFNSGMILKVAWEMSTKRNARFYNMTKTPVLEYCVAGPDPISGAF